MPRASQPRKPRSKALGVEVADLGMMREVEVELGDRCAIVLHDRMKSESEQLGSAAHQALNRSEQTANRRHGHLGIVSGKAPRSDRL